MKTIDRVRYGQPHPPKWLDGCSPEERQFWIDDWKAHRKKGLTRTHFYLQYRRSKTHVNREIQSIRYVGIYHDKTNNAFMSEPTEDITKAVKWVKHMQTAYRKRFAVKKAPKLKEYPPTDDFRFGYRVEKEPVSIPKELEDRFPSSQDTPLDDEC